MSIAVFLFVVLAFTTLTLPDHPDAFSIKAFLRLPIEIPVVALGLLLLPKPMAIVLAVAATLIMAVVLFLKIADIGVQSAFQRRFNPYLDLKMLVDGCRLLSSTIGTLAASLAITAAVGAYLGLVALFCWSQLYLAAAGGAIAEAMVWILGGVLVIEFALWLLGFCSGMPRMVEARAVPYFCTRVVMVVTSIADMHRFERELEANQAAPAQEGLFGALRGRDVVLIFVESYGRSAIEDPRYSPLIGPRLNQVEQQLADTGYVIASGWSKSPTTGGLSWFAHATFLSGLWIDNQARYDRLMMSDRPTLNRLFREAGWRTAAVMPAITMDWKEAPYYGYDDIFAEKDLGYKGKPFNWVTMPDQYTLSAFDRLVRHPARAGSQPVMTEMALISSHAPWTPVPKLIDWNDVGDGAAFNDQAESGDPPPVVWADHARVRRHYIQTIDYSLQALGDYIARFGGDAVFIILGDHQPAALIAGQGASRSVPVHIVCSDRALVERFQPEGFASGMTPARDAPEPSMDTMRDRLIRLFGTH